MKSQVTFAALLIVGVVVFADEQKGSKAHTSRNRNQHERETREAMRDERYSEPVRRAADQAFLTNLLIEGFSVRDAELIIQYQRRLAPLRAEVDRLASNYGRARPYQLTAISKDPSLAGAYERRLSRAAGAVAVAELAYAARDFKGVDVSLDYAELVLNGWNPRDSLAASVILIGHERLLHHRGRLRSDIDVLRQRTANARAASNLTRPRDFVVGTIKRDPTSSALHLRSSDGAVDLIVEKAISDSATRDAIRDALGPASRSDYVVVSAEAASLVPTLDFQQVLNARLVAVDPGLNSATRMVERLKSTRLNRPGFVGGRSV